MSKVDNKLRLDIVSAEDEIFSGDVVRISVMGELGELGIGPGHAPLLTSLKPGAVQVTIEENEFDVFYVSSGMLEVQPHHITILADVAARAIDLDEEAAEQARQKAKQALDGHSKELDYSIAAAQLAEAAAQIQAIRSLRKGRA